MGGVLFSIIFREALSITIEIRAEKVGHAHKVDIPEIIMTRKKVGLTPVQFAELLGISKRTLQEWEQGRKKPSGAV